MSSYDNQPAVLLRWIQHQSVEWLGKPKKSRDPIHRLQKRALSSQTVSLIRCCHRFVLFGVLSTSRLKTFVDICFCVKHFMKLWTEIYRRNKITECKSTEISSIQKNVLMFNMWNKYQHFNILKFKEIKIILNSPKELLKLYSTRSEEHSGPNNSKRKN